ncbi:hypothetical protein [Arthrobacter sp. TE12232]
MHTEYQARPTAAPPNNGETIDRPRSEWANTSAKSRLVRGIIVGVALLVLALSLTGVIDIAPVQTGVTSIKKG